MVFERTEHEPEEYDPEDDFEDPDSDSLTIPRVETEEAGSGLRSDLEADLEVPETAIRDEDVPPDLVRTFWAIVLVINGAVLAGSVGGLLLLFEGDTRRGVPLLAGGIVLLGFAYRRYRTYKRSATSDGDESADSADADPPDPTDADPDAVDDTTDPDGDDTDDNSIHEFG
ncbi:DUF7322 domain-containing protein [Halopiger goleimassiliensis]|uniref:DUF7322 domain-containing protein n=1 Tax=Halopiger goleimassiliensis TaxID=1293048 RepID=UPI000677FA99|nr:hypothetical protein [Halopiger goleimassiliensis]